MDRVKSAIDTIQKRLDLKGTPDPDSTVLDMEFEEFARFHELKSVACASGILTMQEGMTVYNIMGELPSVFNNRRYAEKAALTKLFSELITSV